MTSYASAQTLPGLVLLGIAVLISVRLFYYGRTEQPEDALYLVMNVIGRVMIATALAESCLLMLGGFGILMVVAALVVLGLSLWRTQANRRSVLLAAMASATGKLMPLAPAVEAFSCEWRGAIAWRSRRLAQLLAAGMPLPEALRQTPGLVSAKALAVIEAGSEAGVLGAALGEAARVAAPQEALGRALAPLWYFVNVLIIASGLLTFVTVKIVPAMIKIFSDFDAELPGPMLLVIRGCEWFADYPVAPLALFLLLLLASGYLVLRYLGLAAWDPPLIAGIVRRRDLATVLRTLAVIAEAGRPLDLGLAGLARRHPNESLRRRIALALADIRLGADWCDSFQAQGLLRADETAMLKSAARVGNLPWLLREAAARIERKFALRIQVASQFMVPAVVLAFGGLVFCVVVGMYLPLVALIENLL